MRWLLLGPVVCALLASPAMAAADPAAATATPEVTIGPAVIRANFAQEVASADAQELANWVLATSNHGTLPFMIIDKVQAKVFVFDRKGQLLGTTTALIGLAIGDDSVPGIGNRPLSSIRPHERTTPAGRFVASLARDHKGEELLWVDYDTSVSLHPVVKGHPSERRAQRLASPSPKDHRITYGCINVPVKFYETVVNPTFTGTNGIVYILPETRSARQVFGSYDVLDPAPSARATTLSASP
ncbi:MAG: hypothetical protein ABIR26_12045 [Ramlibacter sp.]